MSCREPPSAASRLHGQHAQPHLEALGARVGVSKVLGAKLLGIELYLCHAKHVPRSDSSQCLGLSPVQLESP